MSKQKTVVDLGVEGTVEIEKPAAPAPQVYETPDKSNVNEEIVKDLRELLKSRSAKVEQVVGKASMLDPSYHNKGIDYRAGGLLDVRWVRNDEAHLNVAQSRHWVFPETISPRLKNLTHNELVLMVRLAEQSENKAKYIEAENRNFETQDFNNNPKISTGGLSEFSVTRPTKRAA